LPNSTRSELAATQVFLLAAVASSKFTVVPAVSVMTAPERLDDVVAELLRLPDLQGVLGGVQQVDLGLEAGRLRHADAVAAPVDGDRAVVVGQLLFGAVQDLPSR
jgi:hypothetical protein